MYWSRMDVGKESGHPISIGLTSDKVLPLRCIELACELLTKNHLKSLTEHCGIAWYDDLFIYFLLTHDLFIVSYYFSMDDC